MKHDGHCSCGQAAFRPGLEDHERTDDNLGLIYRTDLAPDLVGDASFSYDHNLGRGHDRGGAWMCGKVSFTGEIPYFQRRIERDRQS